MSNNIVPNAKLLSRYLAKSSTVHQFCKKILLAKLAPLKDGVIIINENTPHDVDTFQIGKDDKLKTTIIIHRPSFYSRTVLGGSIGNSESYVDGDWDSDNLTNLLRLIVRNREVLNDLDGGIGKILSPIQKYVHGLRNNSLQGSKENIRSHYDIGNDFFELFLDESMMYSSAIFDENNATLAEASQNKLRILGERLKLKPEHHVVEIGTGWGSMAIHLAKTYGCQVTTTTISQEQYDWAKAKIKAAGLEDKINLLFKDYRELEGKFDRLISVEMIEAVGLDHLPTYFKKCSELLKPEGLMVLQAITIKDQYYDQAKNDVDFIQRHIFPGSGIPSIEAMMNASKHETDLSLVEQKDYAESYGKTLNAWHARLKVNKDKIAKLNYPDYLYRLWRYYFSYCEAGFLERSIGVSHLTYTKPQYHDTL